MFKQVIKIIFILSFFVGQTTHADYNGGELKVKILRASGRVESNNSPKFWEAIKKVLKHGHSYPCSQMTPFHKLFDRLHIIEEEKYDRHVSKEGNVGYRIWFDLKEGKGKFSAEKEWDYKVIFCDWDR